MASKDEFDKEILMSRIKVLKEITEESEDEIINKEYNKVINDIKKKDMDIPEEIVQYENINNSNVISWEIFKNCNKEYDIKFAKSLQINRKRKLEEVDTLDNVKR